jgi:Aminotransferase class I and II
MNRTRRPWNIIRVDVVFNIQKIFSVFFAVSQIFYASVVIVATATSSSSSSSLSSASTSSPHLNQQQQQSTTTTAIMTTNGNSNKGGIAARLARPNILELQPYRCARDDYSDGVLLDANENAYGPTSLPTKNLDPYDNSNALERYPDPYQQDLKELFVKVRKHNLQPSNVFVGVGSDEAIDLLMRIFCKPSSSDNILITPPTYGMYKVCAKVNDVTILQAPLTPDFDLDVEKVTYNTNDTMLSEYCYCGCRKNKKGRATIGWWILNILYRLRTTINSTLTS